MSSADEGLVHVGGRVRHAADRTYVVLLQRPGADVEVGRTRRTGLVRQVLAEGAARLLAIDVATLVVDTIGMPQPPYGQDGQLVRITSQESPETADALGQAHWFPPECAWFVTVAGSGTGVWPSEDLDFAPVTGIDELARLERYLEQARRDAGP